MKLYCDKCKKIYESSRKFGDGEDKCPKCGATVPVPVSGTENGAVIGDFRIIRPISSGGMGEVFLAHQVSLDRPAALKVLQQKFVDDKEYVESLFREARLAAKLNHPNIVQAYAVGEEDGVYYFAMEYVEGETFKQVLKKEKILDFDKAAKVIREIAGAINTAWTEQKLVHQDIKPDNIMLAANGKAKLADLGLCQIAAGNQAENVVDDDEDEVLGTPQYISPEQLTGVPTDVRSDIYSLGATFFQFVTGRFPYVADNADDIARMHVAGNLEPPKKFNPELPDVLNSIIIKMMARDIEKRYQSAADLVKDLEAFLNRKKTAAPKAVPSLKVPPKASVPRAVPSLKVPPRAAAAPAAVPPSAVTPPPATPSPAAAPAAVPPPAVVPKPVTAVKESPEETAAEKATEPPADEITDVAGEKEGFFSRIRIPGGKKIMIATGVVAVVVLLLGVGLFLCHKDIIPEPVSGYGKDVLAVIGIGKSSSVKTETPAAAERKAAARPVAVKPRVVKPAAPPKPVTRPEYIAEIKKISSMPRKDAAGKKRFHTAAEAFLYAVYSGTKAPRTAGEREAVEALALLFAPVDEALVFAGGREREAALRNDLIRTHQEKLAAARRAEEEKRQAEARRAEEERERREAEARRIEEEQRRFEAQRRQEQESRVRELRRQITEYNRELCKGFFAAAIKGDTGVLAGAVRNAGELEVSSINDSPEERRMISDLRMMTRHLPAEAEKMKAFVKCVESLDGDDGLVVSFGKDFATIVSIRAGEGIKGKLSGGKIVPVALNSPKLRRAFIRGLSHYVQQDKNVSKMVTPPGRARNRNVVRDRNVAFYYALMNLELEPAVIRMAPDGFWKRIAPIFAECASRDMLKH